MSATSRPESSRPESNRSAGDGSQSPGSRLSVAGEVAHALDLDRAALASMSGQVADVGTLVPGKRGRGVRLASITERAGLRTTARHVHIGSSDPKFAVSVPIAELSSTAVIVFELDGAPLSADKGGPFRLLVPGHPDECVNVKQLTRLEFAAAPGRDTRPKDDAEHAKLHARAAKPSNDT